MGREVSRDAIAALRGEGLIAAGPRSPTPGAPYAYVTTPGFLAQFGFESLRDLPDIEKLEDAGLIGRAGEGALGGDALAAELRGVLGLAATRTNARRMRRNRRFADRVPRGQNSRSAARQPAQPGRCRMRALRLPGTELRCLNRSVAPS